MKGNFILQDSFILPAGDNLFFPSNKSFIDTMSAHREIWEVFGVCLILTERGIILLEAYISP